MIGDHRLWTVGEFRTLICQLADVVALSETSGLRSVKRNAAIGGMPLSAHLIGLAVDVILDEPARVSELTAFAAKMGLIVLDDGDHVHIEPKAW